MEARDDSPGHLDDHRPQDTMRLPEGRGDSPHAADHCILDEEAALRHGREGDRGEEGRGEGSPEAGRGDRPRDIDHIEAEELRSHLPEELDDHKMEDSPIDHEEDIAVEHLSIGLVHQSIRRFRREDPGSPSVNIQPSSITGTI